MQVKGIQIIYFFHFYSSLEEFTDIYTGGGPISTAAYKHHLEQIGDFNGGPYKHHLQNWQFDVSLLENFGKKVYLFSNIFENFSKINLGVMIFFLDCYFWLIFNVFENKKA